MAWPGSRATITAPSAVNAQAITTESSDPSPPGKGSASATYGGTDVSGADTARVTATSSGRAPRPGAAVKVTRDQASHLAIRVLTFLPRDPDPDQGRAQPEPDLGRLHRLLHHRN